MDTNRCPHCGQVLRRPIALTDRFWLRVDKKGPDDCWNWTGTKAHGYGVLLPEGRRYTKGQKVIRAHRFSWELAYGPIPDDKVLRHKCDNRACVNPEHLIPGTQADNVADMIERNRHSRGERHAATFKPQRGADRWNAKLTEDKVREIRRLAAEGMRQCDIAAHFAIPRSEVSRIVNRKRWAHVV